MIRPSAPRPEPLGSHQPLTFAAYETARSSPMRPRRKAIHVTAADSSLLVIVRPLLCTLRRRRGRAHPASCRLGSRLVRLDARVEQRQRLEELAGVLPLRGGVGVLPGGGAVEGGASGLRCGWCRPGPGTALGATSCVRDWRKSVHQNAPAEWEHANLPRRLGTGWSRASCGDRIHPPLLGCARDGLAEAHTARPGKIARQGQVKA